MSKIFASFRAILPGLSLCAGVAALSYGGEAVEMRAVGRDWLEALVLAIILGTAMRTAWTPPQRFERGTAFCAKFVLEVAVVLLGLSVSAAAVIAAGPALIGGIAAIVATAIAMSYGIGRGFGLSHKMAMLIACGNSICGNSAIAATAPVIHADGDDVAASIAFTAVLGVVVVLVLPLLAGLLHLTNAQYGVFAGLTVYAVPQVIAATAPVSALSVQVGTLVKLVRVLMLGPVVLVLSLAGQGRSDSAMRKLPISRLVPWFIVGFLAMVALRSGGFVPGTILAAAAVAGNVLTVVAMAALGLCVDVRVVARAGWRVTGVVVLSLLALAGISLGLIAVLGAA